LPLYYPYYPYITLINPYITHITLTLPLYYPYYPYITLIALITLILPLYYPYYPYITLITLITLIPLIIPHPQSSVDNPNPHSDILHSRSYTCSLTNPKAMHSVQSPFP